MLMGISLSGLRVSAAPEVTWHGQDTPPGRADIIVVNGIDYADYRVGEALAGYDGGSVKHHNITVETGLVPKVKAHPDAALTEEDLSKAAMVVIVNAPAPALHPETRRLVAKHLDDGLRVLIFGGLFSLGKGQYADTELLEICPVHIQSPWSVRKLEPPAPLHPAPGVSFAGDLDWGAEPCVLYHHADDLKEGTQTWLQARGAPILVVRDIGKGRAAAFLSAPIGKPPEGVLAYWEWEDWPGLLREIVRKLLESSSETGTPGADTPASDAHEGRSK